MDRFAIPQPARAPGNPRDPEPPAAERESPFPFLTERWFCHIAGAAQSYGAENGVPQPLVRRADADLTERLRSTASRSCACMNSLYCTSTTTLGSSHTIPRALDAVANCCRSSITQTETETNGR